MGKQSAKPLRRLYLATNNAHKKAELAAMAEGLFEIHLAKDLDPHINWDENGETCLANARIKAHAVKALTDCCVLADDSGLEVEGLGGAPGVHSSRYAGEEGNDPANNAKLLEAMQGVPTDHRTARFVCVLYFIDEAGNEQWFEGSVRGRILEHQRGLEGFGYDPLFLVEDTGKTMAELSAREKNRVSHRRRAFDAFIKAVT